MEETAAFAVRSDRFKNQRQQTREILQRDEWFSQWPSATLELLINSARLETYFDGQFLYQQGDKCNAMLVVLSGALQLGWPSEDGRYVVLCYLGEAHVLNLAPLLDGIGVDHDYRAHGTTTVATIDRQIILDCLEQNKALAYSIIGFLCRRNRLLHEELRYQNLSSLRTRLAHRLYQMAHMHGRDNDQGREIVLRLSQENIAALMASSRQSINRELSLLREQGVIETRYNKILVRDMAALQKIGISI